MKPLLGSVMAMAAAIGVFCVIGFVYYAMAGNTAGVYRCAVTASYPIALWFGYWAGDTFGGTR